MCYCGSLLQDDLFCRKYSISGRHRCETVKRTKITYSLNGLALFVESKFLDYLLHSFNACELSGLLTDVKSSAAHIFPFEGFHGVFGVFVILVIDESIGSLEDKESKRVSESGRDIAEDSVNDTDS